MDQVGIIKGASFENNFLNLRLLNCGARWLKLKRYCFKLKSEISVWSQIEWRTAKVSSKGPLLKVNHQTRFSKLRLQLKHSLKKLFGRTSLKTHSKNSFTEISIFAVRLPWRFPCCSLLISYFDGRVFLPVS